MPDKPALARHDFHDDGAPAEFDPRKCLGSARRAMEKVCVEHVLAFGWAGHTGKIKVVTCREMVSFYQVRRTQAKGLVLD